MVCAEFGVTPNAMTARPAARTARKTINSVRRCMVGLLMGLRKAYRTATRTCYDRCQWFSEGCNIGGQGWGPGVRRFNELSADLSAENRALAEALRKLFVLLDESLNAYSAATGGTTNRLATGPAAASAARARASGARLGGDRARAARGAVARTHRRTPGLPGHAGRGASGREGRGDRGGAYGRGARGSTAPTSAARSYRLGRADAHERTDVLPTGDRTRGTERPISSHQAELCMIGVSRIDTSPPLPTKPTSTGSSVAQRPGPWVVLLFLPARLAAAVFFGG